MKKLDRVYPYEIMLYPYLKQIYTGIYYFFKFSDFTVNRSFV